MFSLISDIRIKVLFARYLFIFGIVIVIAGLVLVQTNRLFFINLYNDARLYLLSDGGEQCLEELLSLDANFKSLGQQGTDQCPVKNAVRISSFNNTDISSDIILSCPTAVNVAKWLNEIDARNVTHMGSLNCRTRRGSRLMSEHSFGTAIDISEIDGASVLHDWDDKASKGNILRKAALAACSYFSAVLTPESNRLHKNHFHLDNGLAFRCDARPKAKLR